MLEWLAKLTVWQQALLATLFTYAMTALGAGCVYFFKKENKIVLSLMQGIAAGVMIAASFFSLLKPAEEQLAESKHRWWILGVSFFVGGVLILLTDIFLKKKNVVAKKSSASHTFLAMTLHNIPEGFAVGVAFGSIVGNDTSALVAAILLTTGIAIQNFPEGMCVALCARQEGATRNKSFFLGQFSGVVEIIAGVIGAIAVVVITNLLPWALSFSAGAMISVACIELIPDCVSAGKKLATLSIVIGFVIMMVLDVAF